MPRKKKERGQRTIKESRAGRVFWTAGQEHPLDVLFRDANALQEQLPHQLSAMLQSAQYLHAHLAPLLTLETNFEELERSLTATDHRAFVTIAERFADRKHVAHLEAILAIVRRKRLLGRLKALQAALELAAGLFAEEESLSQEYIQSVMATYIQHEAEAHHERSSHESETDQAPSPSLSKEHQRLKGINEPITPLVTSATHSRELLRAFEAQLPELRAHLSSGNGWFEPYYIRKKRLKEAVKVFTRALRRERTKGIQVPEAIEQAVHAEVAQVLRQEAPTIPKHLRDAAYDYAEYGPYVKYRWRENKQIYSVSLGLTSDYPKKFFCI